MEKIESFTRTVQYLKEGEIVMLADRTAMFIRNQRIEVCSGNSHYTLSFTDFRDLYENSTFYLYQPSYDEIDMEKDAAYYSWKNQSIN